MVTFNNKALFLLFGVANVATVVSCFSFSSVGKTQMSSFGYRQGHRNHHLVSTYTTTSTQLFAEKEEQQSSNNSGSTVEEYRNLGTSILANFMQKDEAMNNDETANNDNSNDPLKDIDFNADKISKVTDLETLAAMLDAELYEKEWFVTGNVNPSYFADEFEFQDPDVKVKGIEDYAKGVRKIFDQQTSRAEIISSDVTDTNKITITWRLSGKVNIGPGLTIKPYICYTDFVVDEESGLIVFQEDRFDIPGWDILLSSLFPFLIGKVTSPPAPPVEPRPKPTMPSIISKDSSSPLDKLMQLFN